MKKIESGRSLFETIVIMCLISLLIFGGVWFFQTAFKRYKSMQFQRNLLEYAVHVSSHYMTEGKYSLAGLSKKGPYTINAGKECAESVAEKNDKIRYLCSELNDLEGTIIDFNFFLDVPHMSNEFCRYFVGDFRKFPQVIDIVNSDDPSKSVKKGSPTAGICSGKSVQFYFRLDLKSGGLKAEIKCDPECVYGTCVEGECRCYEGYYDDVTDDKGCLACPKGSATGMKGVGARSCKECSGNTYSSLSANALCYACPRTKPLVVADHTSCRYPATHSECKQVYGESAPLYGLVEQHAYILPQDGAYITTPIVLTDASKVILDGDTKQELVKKDFTGGVLTTQGITSKIKTIEVYENDELMDKLIPIKIYNQGAFFDTLTGKVFYNAGKGTLSISDTVVADNYYCRPVLEDNECADLYEDTLWYSPVKQECVAYLEDTDCTLIDPSKPFVAYTSYLEASGTQYINTRYKPTNYTKIEVAYRPYAWNANVFGNTHGTGLSFSDGFMFSQYGTGNVYYLFGSLNFSDPTSLGIKEQNTLNTDHYISMSQSGGYFDGIPIKYTQYEKGLFTSSTELYLFTLYNRSTGKAGNKLKGRIYKAQIYEKGTLVLNLVPVKKDGQACMIDTLTQTLYCNQGTGNFKYVRGNVACRGPENDRECAIVSSETPWYDQEKGCVECIENYHCPEATPICDKDTRTCRTAGVPPLPCQSNSECTNGTCAYGVCAKGCTSDSDCPTDYACSTSTGQCMYCLYEWDGVTQDYRDLVSSGSIESAYIYSYHNRYGEQENNACLVRMTTPNTDCPLVNPQVCGPEHQWITFGQLTVYGDEDKIASRTQQTLMACASINSGNVGISATTHTDAEFIKGVWSGTSRGSYFLGYENNKNPIVRQSHPTKVLCTPACWKGHKSEETPYCNKNTHTWEAMPEEGSADVCKEFPHMYYDGVECRSCLAEGKVLGAEGVCRLPQNNDECALVNPLMPVYNSTTKSCQDMCSNTCIHPQVCDGTTGQCVSPQQEKTCEADTDCPNGADCFRGICAYYCNDKSSRDTANAYCSEILGSAYNCDYYSKVGGGYCQNCLYTYEDGTIDLRDFRLASDTTGTGVASDWKGSGKSTYKWYVSNASTGACQINVSSGLCPLPRDGLCGNDYTWTERSFFLNLPDYNNSDNIGFNSRTRACLPQSYPQIFRDAYGTNLVYGKDGTTITTYAKTGSYPILCTPICYKNQKSAVNNYCYHDLHEWRPTPTNDAECAMADKTKPIFEAGVPCRQEKSEKECNSSSVNLGTDISWYVEGKGCVQCTQNYHCPSEAPICDQETNTCRVAEKPPKECTSDAQCTDDTKCVDGFCTKQGCVADANCPTDYACDYQSGDCVYCLYDWEGATQDYRDLAWDINGGVSKTSSVIRPFYLEGSSSNACLVRVDTPNTDCPKVNPVVCGPEYQWITQAQATVRGFEFKKNTKSMKYMRACAPYSTSRKYPIHGKFATTHDTYMFVRGTAGGGNPSYWFQNTSHLDTNYGAYHTISQDMNSRTVCTPACWIGRKTPATPYCHKESHTWVASLNDMCVGGEEAQIYQSGTQCISCLASGKVLNSTKTGCRDPKNDTECALINPLKPFYENGMCVDLCRGCAGGKVCLPDSTLTSGTCVEPKDHLTCDESTHCPIGSDCMLGQCQYYCANKGSSLSEKNSYCATLLGDGWLCDNDASYGGYCQNCIRTHVDGETYDLRDIRLSSETSPSGVVEEWNSVTGATQYFYNAENNNAYPKACLELHGNTDCPKVREQMCGFDYTWTTYHTFLKQGLGLVYVDLVYTGAILRACVGTNAAAWISGRQAQSNLLYSGLRFTGSEWGGMIANSDGNKDGQLAQYAWCTPVCHKNKKDATNSFCWHNLRKWAPPPTNSEECKEATEGKRPIFEAGVPCRVPKNDAECAQYFPQTPWFKEGIGCVQCLENFYCPQSTPICDKDPNNDFDDYVCRNPNNPPASCSNNADCDSSNGETCVEGVCALPCSSDTDCPYDFACDPTHKKCMFCIYNWMNAILDYRDMGHYNKSGDRGYRWYNPLYSDYNNACLVDVTEKGADCPYINPLLCGNDYTWPTQAQAMYDPIHTGIGSLSLRIARACIPGSSPGNPLTGAFATLSSNDANYTTGFHYGNIQVFLSGDHPSYPKVANNYMMCTPACWIGYKSPTTPYCNKYTHTWVENLEQMCNGEEAEKAEVFLDGTVCRSCLSVKKVLNDAKTGCRAPKNDTECEKIDPLKPIYNASTKKCQDRCGGCADNQVCKGTTCIKPSGEESCTTNDDCPNNADCLNGICMYQCKYTDTTFCSNLLGEGFMCNRSFTTVGQYCYNCIVPYKGGTFDLRTLRFASETTGTGVSKTTTEATQYYWYNPTKEDYYSACTTDAGAGQDCPAVRLGLCGEDHVWVNAQFMQDIGLNFGDYTGLIHACTQSSYGGMLATARSTTAVQVYAGSHYSDGYSRKNLYYILCRPKDN